jgi:DNA-binding response OmpR family regulator
MMNKILIVDDDAAIRMLYEDELTDEGYEVLTCGEGPRVMHLIEQNGPDLLLMDIRLDGSSGLDILQGIRNRYTELPVILCTAYPAYKYDMKSVAADDYVVKSSDLKELKEKIGKILHGDKSLAPVEELCEEKK